MTELTTEQLKETCKNILVQFDAICREHHLRYSAGTGTLIGAVRHGGFIPWDDDIDLLMPREDYEKLLALQYEDEHYKIMNYRYCKGYYHTFTKMIDKRTYIDEPLRAEKNMGVFIDIFPTDYFDDISNAAAIAEKARRNADFWNHLGADINYHKGFTPRYAAKLLFRLAVLPFRKRLLYHFDNAFNKQKSGRYCANLQLAFYKEREFFETRVWDETIYLPFEDTEVAVFKDYDTYLTGIIGDYMTPPPENQRCTTHTFTAYKR